MAGDKRRGILFPAGEKDQAVLTARAFMAEPAEPWSRSFTGQSPPVS